MESFKLRAELIGHLEDVGGGARCSAGVGGVAGLYRLSLTAND